MLRVLVFYLGVPPYPWGLFWRGVSFSVKEREFNNCPISSTGLKPKGRKHCYKADLSLLQANENHYIEVFANAAILTPRRTAAHLAVTNGTHLQTQIELWLAQLHLEQGSSAKEALRRGASQQQ